MTHRDAIADAALAWAVARAEHNALRLAIHRRGVPPAMADHLALMAAVDRIDAAARRLHALALPADWRPAGVVEQMQLELEVGA